MPGHSPDCDAIAAFLANAKVLDQEVTGFIAASLVEVASGRTMDAVHGLSWESWCWLRKEDAIVFSKEGRIQHLDVSTLQTEEIHVPQIPPGYDFEFPHLTPSPDDTRIGFYIGQSFLVMNLKDRRTEELFSCDHYFASFDWGEHGIVYLDAVGRERRSRARLMVYDPEKKSSREVATGPFAFPTWAQG